MIYRKGFSLIEIMIVVAILAILTMVLILTFTRQRDKADDARIKSDLARLKIAFEDYYNDHNCYPPPDWFDDAGDCGSDRLKPYLSAISCNKKTGLPYPLATDPTGCTWFKIYATLHLSSDPQILATPLTIGSSTYNYGVSSTNINLTTVAGGNSTPSDTIYYCLNDGDANGNCTTKPSNLTCTNTFINDPNCLNGCLNTISACN